MYIVRTLRLPQHRRVLGLLAWQTTHESTHIETIKLATCFLFFVGCLHVLPVRVEQAGEASYKGCANLIRMERRWADEADLSKTTAVCTGTAADTFICTL